MRRSLGGGSRGMGGGSGGGGGMLRTVHRAVRAGIGGAAQEPFSHSTSKTTNTTTTTTRPTYKSSSSSNNNNLSLSSSSPSASSNNLPISAAAASTAANWVSSCTSPTCSEEFDWECIDGIEDERINGFYDDFVFGAVPSKDEVQFAVSSLQQVLDPASFSEYIRDRIAYNSDSDAASKIINPTAFHKPGSDLDWIEPSLNLCNSRTLHSLGSERVYDAFHLLQTEPTVQRMVVSLSSDKAVWNAVLNNEVVRELRESFSEAEKSAPGSSTEGSDGSNVAAEIIRWIFTNTKAKVMEIVGKITMLVNELLQPPDEEKGKEGAADPFNEILRSSFMLTVVVLMIVVMNRAHKD